MHGVEWISGGNPPPVFALPLPALWPAVLADEGEALMNARRLFRAWPFLPLLLVAGLWQIRADLLEIGDAAVAENARLEASHATAR